MMMMMTFIRAFSSVECDPEALRVHPGMTIRNLERTPAAAVKYIGYRNDCSSNKYSERALSENHTALMLKRAPLKGPS